MSDLVERARAYWRQCSPHIKDRVGPKLVKELADEVERLQNPWTSVEEALPTKPDAYEVAFTNGGQWYASWYRDDWSDFEMNAPLDPDLVVAYWKPMTPVPK